MYSKKLAKLTLPLAFCFVLSIRGLFIPANYKTANAFGTKISIENLIQFLNTSFPSNDNKKTSCEKDSSYSINEDINRDGEKELIIWNHDTRDAYKVEVLRKNDSDYVDDPLMYPYYFQNVVNYYKTQLKKPYNSKSPIMWYYLSDAELKMNKPKEALISIEQGISNLKNDDSALYGMLLSLKGESLRRLGDYEAALKTLDKAMQSLISSKFSDNASIINTYFYIGKTLDSIGYDEVQKEYYRAAISLAAKEYGVNSKDYNKITYKIQRRLNKMSYNHKVHEQRLTK